MDDLAGKGKTAILRLFYKKRRKKYYEEYGLHFMHASDEWYITAGRDFPEEERYDGYLQLENGVGMLRLLFEEFTEGYKNNL